MKSSRSPYVPRGPGRPVASQRLSCRKNHGLASAPRPMAMPAQPVSREHPVGVADRPDVAVADDRDALDGLDDGADAVEVDATR